jgi:hypothetical protein
MGHLPKALVYLTECLRIAKLTLGPDHHAVATTLSNMGNLQRVRAVFAPAMRGSDV